MLKIRILANKEDCVGPGYYDPLFKQRNRGTNFHASKTARELIYFNKPREEPKLGTFDIYLCNYLINF